MFVKVPGTVRALLFTPVLAMWLTPALAQPVSCTSAHLHCSRTNHLGCCEPRDYFYKASPYGSASQFNPLTVFVNGAFDILRNQSYRSSPFDVDYGTGFSNLWRNLKDPFGVIKDGGGGRFVAHEIFPYRGLKSQYGQFVPNYVLHALGEGMLTRMLAEWYRAHNVPWHYFFGISTVFLMQWMNEVVENGSYEGANGDPISDIYLFNTLGYILFSIDGVARFFSGHPVQMNYWPHQAALDVRTGELFNHGQNFAFKFNLGEWTDYKAFAYFGVEGLLGLSAPISESDSISIGAGLRLLELEPEPSPGFRVLVPKGNLNVELAAFWDRDESLMASVFLGGPGNWLVQANLYPGVLNLQGLAFGAYAIVSEFDGVSLGLSFQLLPLVPGVLFAKDRSQEVF